MADALTPCMRVDAAIVGGGPAGLSAALVLGRCRRGVVVFDDRNYRNCDARVLRGYLTRDHVRTTPDELRALGRADVARYDTVQLIEDSVVEIRRNLAGYVLLTASGTKLEATAVLLATGFRDTLPAIAGARELHGELVAPCPYCDAYEVRDQPLAAFSHPDESGARFAAVVSQWSDDVIFCAERRPQISDAMRQLLARKRVRVEHRELRSVDRERDGIRLVFAEGETVWRRMLFYHLGGEPVSNLAVRLGAETSESGSVIVDRHQASSLPGLFVAGDATRDVLQAIVAAGEGSSAGVSINEYLCQTE
jgi:thioredoxin reductase